MSKFNGVQKAVPQRRKKPPVAAWLSVFVALPLGVWLAASFASGFAEKRVSNFAYEPLLILILSSSLFGVWFLLARRGLRPLVGIFLLTLLAAAAYEIQRLFPPFRE